MGSFVINLLILSVDIKLFIEFSIELMTCLDSDFIILQTWPIQLYVHEQIALSKLSIEQVASLWQGFGVHVFPNIN